jgi:predicted enzyme related to lactoylglutathione lyase
MIKINSIAFFAYPVTDLARAKSFYEGLLGLKPSHVFEHEGKAWIEYDIGQDTLCITNMAPDWKPGAQGGSIAFELEDFDGSVAVLKKAGVPFPLDAMKHPSCSMAVISDPDGNNLTLHKIASHAEHCH